MRTLTIYHLGLTDYTTAWEVQRRIARARSAGEVGDTLLLVEHPPTITLGRKARAEHVRVSAEYLNVKGVTVVHSDRGGGATYHAPGQIVAYPIFKLSQHGRDIGRYLRGLEESVIRVLFDYGLSGERVPGLTGVWVRNGAAKICAIGIKVSAGGVTMHGLALNVNIDMHGFDLIVPCGVYGRSVTSMAAELGEAPAMSLVSERLVGHLCNIFDLEPTPVVTVGQWKTHLWAARGESLTHAQQENPVLPDGENSYAI
ncbi:MAG: lipoyl(octanoyl) transferase LipB [Roseiflexus sp.]